MSKISKITIIALILIVVAVCYAATSDPWDGTTWDVAAPDILQPIGNHYKEMYDLRKGVGIRMNKEHETLAASSAGGVHKQGSARAFFQDAAPTTQIDGTAWDSGDRGSFWVDPNSSPDDELNILTDHASTGTWTPISTEIIATLLASNRQFAGTLTVDGATTLTGNVTITGTTTANSSITLGAGDDLIGSSTSDITINTNKFTVARDTGNTLVAGTFTSTGVATVAKGSLLASSDAPTTDAMITNKKYVDDKLASEGIQCWVQFASNGTIQGTGYNITSVTRTTDGDYDILWATDFADNDYAVVATCVGAQYYANITDVATTGCTVETITDSGAKADSACCVIAIGTQ